MSWQGSEVPRETEGDPGVIGQGLGDVGDWLEVEILKNLKFLQYISLSMSYIVKPQPNKKIIRSKGTTSKTNDTRRY